MSVVRELITALGFEYNDDGAKKYEDSFTKLKDMAIHAAEILGVVEVGKKLIEAGMEGEQVAMQFETALGSAEKANAFLSQLGDFAMKTGFNKDMAEDYSKQLIYMGLSTEKVIPTLNMLGDIAVGVGQDKMPILVDAIGKMQQTGKVESRNFMALLSAGVPILEELRKQTGMSTDQIKKMGQAGTLSYSDMEKALKALTSTGGKFDNLLEKQSMTMQGMLNRFKNMFGEMSEQLGLEIIPLLKEIGFGVLKWLGENFEKIKTIFVKVFSIIAYALGFAYQLFINLSQSILGTSDVFGVIIEVVDSFLTGLQALMPIIMPIVAAIGLWTAAQWLLNIALTANPIGLIIAGVAILIAVVGLIIKNWKKIGDFFKKLWDGVVETFKGVIKWITDLVGGWIKGIQDFFSNLWNGLVYAIQHPFETISNIIKAYIDFWISLFKGIWDFIQNIIKAVGDFFGGGNVNVTANKNINQTIVPKTQTAPVVKNNNIQVDSKVNIGVPDGTPAQQQQAIKTQVNQAIQDSWQQQLRSINNQTPAINFSGANQ